MEDSFKKEEQDLTAQKEDRNGTLGWAEPSATPSGLGTAALPQGQSASPREPLSEKAKKEAEEKRKKRAAAKAYRERYFAYYDDVKTKIKEDW